MFAGCRLPKWVKRRPNGSEIRPLLYPCKQTQAGHRGMSASCQRRKNRDVSVLGGMAKTRPHSKGHDDHDPDDLFHCPSNRVRRSRFASPLPQRNQGERQKAHRERLRSVSARAPLHAWARPQMARKAWGHHRIENRRAGSLKLAPSFFDISDVRY